MPGLLVAMDSVGQPAAAPAAASIAPDAAAADAPQTRRKSGRAIAKPVLYSEDPKIPANSVNGKAKRKRGARVSAAANDVGADAESSSDDNVGDGQEDDEDGFDSDPGEEDFKERKRRNTKAGKKASQGKPAAKKPKTNKSAGVKLAMRPANTNGVKRVPKAPKTPKASKPRKVRVKVPTKEGDTQGLYGEVFLQGHAPEDVASSWLEKYNERNAESMCDLINFVLRCTGCELQVDIHDIEDPDNATGKLTDLQDEYQAQDITEYPLIARARGNTFSRPLMTGFFQAIVQIAHTTGLLYADATLIENIQTWVIPMSSSPIRPFRHTATVVSLALSQGACKNMEQIMKAQAATSQQMETEKKKKPLNRGRVSALNTKIKEDERKRIVAESILKDNFDTIFVHRYRDVDPRIRLDSIAALGDWMILCPDLFFESQYLRYFGWLLSDLSAPARTEVVRQLLRIYKPGVDVGRVRAFTERFRVRMIEMAVRDAEASIRALTVELLNAVRSLGLLEPDDIDTLGRLIFDAEPRVRKAIAPFFATNVNDSYDLALEELGGEETLEEAVGEVVDGDYERPRRTWLTLKCIAELLDSYDLESSENSTPAPGMESLITSSKLETRYALAGHAIFEGIEEVHDWEIIAGYLLSDMSSSSRTNEPDDSLANFKRKCLLTEKEERLLLEILHASVKLRLAEVSEPEIDKRGRKTNAKKNENRVVQETTALHLAKVIPPLLRKYGASPQTASAVLRLEHVLDLEIFQALRHDTTEFAALLDDINTQFSTHADRSVLAEASTALLHASSFEDLEEVTETKVQDLWDTTLAKLRQAYAVKTPQPANLSSATHRILQLARISDCTDVFIRDPPKMSKGVNQQSAPSLKVIDILLNLVQTHKLVEDVQANSLVTNSLNALLYYHMWSVATISKSPDRVPDGKFKELRQRSEELSDCLVQVIDARVTLDDVRLTAIGNLLDLHVLYATFRNDGGNGGQQQPAPSIVSGTQQGQLLGRDVPQKGVDLATASFTALEKAFARKARKQLEDPTDEEVADEAPESDDELDESDEEPADAEEHATWLRRKQQALLLAEKRLCEVAGKLVLAILAKVLDTAGEKKGELRKRITRNRAKLGPNFREVLAYLEEPKAKRGAKGGRQVSSTAKDGAAARKDKDVKSSELVGEDDDHDEEEEEVGDEIEVRPEDREEVEDDEEDELELNDDEELIEEEEGAVIEDQGKDQDRDEDEGVGGEEPDNDDIMGD